MQEHLPVQHANDFGKPEKRIIYVNVICEYALKKKFVKQR